jgi:hypothetical protein
MIIAEEMSGTNAAHSGSVYVYGVVRSGTLRSIDAEGIGGAEVELIERDDLAALVSAVPATKPRISRRDLHRHLGVIEAAFAQTTVLPCPFGTVATSATELEDGLLGAASPNLLAGIERLNGCVQMNVKAAYDEDTLLREIVSADPTIAGLRERTRGAGNAGYYERLQLGELVAARVAERRTLDAERLLDNLLPLAVDAVVDEPDEGCALKASFLVDRKRLPRFDAGLESLSRREQPLLVFEAIGPLPPTAFAAAYAST